MTSTCKRSLPWIAIAALNLISGCSKTETKTCLNYLCISGATFTGSVPYTQAIPFFDVELCFEGKCHSGLIDPAAKGGAIPCAYWNPFADVCINPPSADAGASEGDAHDAGASEAGGSTQSPMWQIEAHWDHSDLVHHPADGSHYRLRIVDHATGMELLDVTRAAHYVHRPQQDDCHNDCFTAQLKF